MPKMLIGKETHIKEPTVDSAEEEVVSFMGGLDFGMVFDHPVELNGREVG